MDEDELDVVLQVLGELRRRPVDDPDRIRVQRAFDGLLKDTRKQRRAERHRRAAAADRALVERTGLGAPSRPPGEAVPVREPAGTVGRTGRDRLCYVCREPYRAVDAFYHTLCPDCATVNRRHREARTDLHGRRALVTGGRVKIGHQVALKLLRDGAEVTVVTRFPADAARRFAAAAGSAAWLPALRVIGADLRDPRQVLDLADRVGGSRLDILINNAAQTVRRPPWAYRPLVEGELDATVRGHVPELVTGYRPAVGAPGWGSALTAGPGWGSAPRTGPGDEETREDQQRVDPTGALLVPGAANSWSALLGEIGPVELLEVQLVNVVAPFLLLDRLRPALTAPGAGRRYVVNVTGREGQLGGGGRAHVRHPHTSVAKAALNMLTRVAADGLAEHDVFVCGVDTGWASDEAPEHHRAARAAGGWQAPLDVVDAAARIYHPVVSGETGSPLQGVLLKDYAPVPW